MTEIHINALSKTEFASSEVCRRLITHEYARRFASLDLPECSSLLTLSWRSDLIDPTVVVDKSESVIWVGIDDRVAAVTTEGKILFSIALPYPVLTVLLFSGGAIVICELQAIVINRDSTIRAIVDFPDIPETYTINEDQLSVVFMDGSSDEFGI